MTFTEYRSPVLLTDFDDLAEPPRCWCDDCRAYRLFRRDMDGYPICRVCSEQEGD